MADNLDLDSLPLVWLAYYKDWSEFAIFVREIDALRYAIGKQMLVVTVTFGADVREQVGH